jgi:transposase-like protein
MSSTEPETLVEAIRFFSDPDVCREYVAALRWPGGVTCPSCGGAEVTYLPSVGRWQCKAKHPRRQFSVKNGTIFEDSPLSLDKWLAVIWMLANAKNGVSSYEIHRSIGVTQKAAWFMLKRVRLAMQTGTFERERMGGPGSTVEADETYIGGKARNMHRDQRKLKITGRGGAGKAAVMGLLERHTPTTGSRARSEVRLTVVPNVRKGTLAAEVRQAVEPGSNLYTDALGSYLTLGEEYRHKVVDHAERYVDGHVHTNGLENFWSLLKRSLGGTYVSVEAYHLFRYLDEQAFRFNLRHLTDGERFKLALAGIVGKRLTYSELTGKFLGALA